MSGHINFQGAGEYEEVPEVPEVEPQDERERELRTLRQTLRSTQEELIHEQNEVRRLTHQCRELSRRADAQEERADSQRKRRLDDNEVFWQKLRRARAEAADGQRRIENVKEERDLLAMDLIRLRSVAPTLHEGENAIRQAEELILCFLATAGAVETSFSLLADGKMKVSVLMNDKGTPRYYAAYATSETGEMFRGQMIAEKWREDRWVGERSEIRLKLGAVQVANFGKPRKVPTSLAETLRNSLLVSVCLSGFLETEILRQELSDRGTVVPK
ncbi:hypothetical protein Y032_0055g2628 [Ancylostoma ceylanicum]|uniref:Uncharacterized protein n=1 Tax=Ancylostoma ceylanicum TaxID=53326 RepID=A0A016U7M9_9BILA|nr:hypothetical protein Y032_0055g2628 [Ancylostoma ceylanicum]